MNIKLILNPVSGKGKGKRFLSRIKKWLNPEDVSVTEKPGDGFYLAKEASEKNFDVICAAGGDGTLNEVINGVIASGKDIPVGFVPLGITNVFALASGIPRDVKLACRLIKEGKPKRIDLGCMNRAPSGLPRRTLSESMQKGEIQANNQKSSGVLRGLPPQDALSRRGGVNGRYFTLMVGLGYDAKVIKGVSSFFKQLFGKLAFIISGFREWLRYKPEEIKIEAGERKSEATLAVIANSRFYGGKFFVCPRASLFDGKIDLCFFGKRGKWKLFKFLIAAIFNRHLKLKDTHYQKCERIRVFSSQDISLQMDGDAIESVKEAEFIASPEKIKMILPSREIISRRTFRPLSSFLIQDFLIFGFLMFLSIIVILFWQALPLAFNLLLKYIILGLFLFLFIYWERVKETKPASFLHAFFPVLVIPIIFDSLGDIIPWIISGTVDHFLINLDKLIFTVHPTIWLEKIFHPVLSEIMYLAYAMYYFYPLIFVGLLFAKKERWKFDRTVFLLCLTFFLSYIGYFLFPAVGPRFTLEHMQSIPLEKLDGPIFSQTIRMALDNLENIKYDAFPSGHTAAVLLILYLSFKYIRKLFWIFLFPIILLIFSTVYCRYHYVVDIFAGLLLVAVVIWFGNSIGEWFDAWLKRIQERSLKSS